MSQPLKVAFIPNPLIEQLLNEARRTSPLETGGILMGWQSSNLGCCITDVIGPGPNAKHTSWSFDPDYNFQRQIVASVYEASGRLHSYLGDWHTHPRGTEHLSALDVAALRHIAGAREARCRAPLMLLIVGGPNWTFKLWQYSPLFPRSQQAVALQVI